MSVPLSKRGTSKLDIIQLSNDIEVQIIRIIQNEKYVPKRARLIVGKNIIDTAMDMSRCFCEANNLMITTNEIKFKLRQQYQYDGYAHLGALEHQLNLIYILYNIPHGLLEDIFDKISKIKQKFNGWIKSDKQRFEKLINEKESKNEENS